MSLSLKRATAPSLAVLAVAVVPLAMPGAANAAMGGAIPATTTLRPDLRTATVQPATAQSQADVTTTVRFCFNKNINSLPTANAFRLGSYRQASVTADDAVRVGAATGMCADATFSAAPIDVTQLTHATASGNATTNSTNGFGNLADSTALIQAPGTTATSNGTVGRTVAPDLIGITVNNASDTINFIFDQNVRNVNPAAGSFVFNDAQGNTVGNLGGAIPGNVTAASNVVAAKFPPASVNAAVRAYVTPFTVQALAVGFDVNSQLMSATRPMNGGFTDRPDLLSTTLSGGTVSFVFDETITAANAASFYATRSDGTNVGGTVSIANGNTVNLSVTDGGAQNEYLVAATALDGGVTGVVAPAGRLSTAGGLPIGGNAGAFATGFTTGPEALRATFSAQTGVASVLLDQRFNTGIIGGFILFDDAGTQIGTSLVSASGAGGAAGQATAQASFTPAQLTGARSIQLIPGALTTFTGATNVVQILSPTATAAVLSRGSKVQFRSAKALKNTKKLRQLLRRQLKSSR